MKKLKSFSILAVLAALAAFPSLHGINKTKVYVVNKTRIPFKIEKITTKSGREYPLVEEKKFGHWYRAKRDYRKGIVGFIKNKKTKTITKKTTIKPNSKAYIFSINRDQNWVEPKDTLVNLALAVATAGPAAPLVPIYLFNFARPFETKSTILMSEDEREQFDITIRSERAVNLELMSPKNYNQHSRLRPKPTVKRRKGNLAKARLKSKFKFGQLYHNLYITIEPK